MDRTKNVDANGVALGGYSPVSYVDLGRPEPGRPEHSVDHNGARYLFTDAAQVDTFRADPDRYEPAYGGWCAFGATVNENFACDPLKFKVVDGRLMTFLHNDEVDALALWEEGDEGELLAKADATWHGAEA